MRQLVLLIVFLLTGCNPSPSNQMSEKPLTEHEKRSLAAVMDAYHQHKITILDKEGTARQVVGAQTALLNNYMHEHYISVPDESQAVGGSREHYVTLVTQAKIAPKKEYSQPVIQAGTNVYFYKILYIASVDNKTLTLKKTIAREDADLREEAAVEPDLIRAIAGAAAGKVMGEQIVLP